MQQTLATFTLPTMFGEFDRILLAPMIIPTGGNLLAAIAELEARPYGVTPQQIDEQYDNERGEFVEAFRGGHFDLRADPRLPRAVGPVDTAGQRRGSAS
jgi:hypothetical protein